MVMMREETRKHVEGVVRVKGEVGTCRHVGEAATVKVVAATCKMEEEENKVVVGIDIRMEWVEMVMVGVETCTSTEEERRKMEVVGIYTHREVVVKGKVLEEPWDCMARAMVDALVDKGSSDLGFLQAVVTQKCKVYRQLHWLL